jgi:hypothetical protein
VVPDDGSHEGVKPFVAELIEKCCIALVKKRIGVYVGENRHAVRGAANAALRAVMA